MGQDTDWDYLIVGQGLAGSLLAWQLHHDGRRVLVIDDCQPGAASRAAAGLVNPLAGMRFTLPAPIEHWEAAATRLYARLAAHFGETFFHPVPMVRLFRSAEQVRFWQRRLSDPRAAAYLGARFASGRSGEPVRDPHGGFHQRRTGYLDVGRLLARIHAELVAAGCLREQALEHAALRPRPRGIDWHGLHVRQVVFCEGYRVARNPWFGWLPLRTDRGEILTLEAAPHLPRRIVNGAHWLVPLAEGGCRAGSTHDHADLDATPTVAAREAILAGVGDLLTGVAEVHVTDQRAGVRPGTGDRQPVVGRHPRQPGFAVLNGFGARGSLTIPWYAQRLIRHLEHGDPLPPEADVARFGGSCPA